MTSISRRVRLGSAIGVLVALASATAIGQTREKGPWWPSVWGAGDQAGASNWITAEKVLESVRLVKTGKVYELGHVYERGMPGLSNQRTFNLFLVGPNFSGGENRFVYNDEFVSGALGQMGTQFDGLGHAAMRMKMADGTEQDVYYNGFTGAEITDAHGLKSIGIEHVKPIVTRGILVDVPALKGVESLTPNYEVTVDDVRAALKRQGIAEDGIKPGDAFFFRYGWARYWNDPKRPNPAPGINMDVARWIVERRASMVGSDQAALEVTKAGQLFPVHQELIMKHGIYNHENLTLDELARDRVYEFLFVFTPLRLKGATGSPGRPIAIR
jgi:kynurenine formamidase